LSQRSQNLRVLFPSWSTRRRVSLSKWRTCKCSTGTHLQQRNNNNRVSLLLPCGTFSSVLLLQMTRVSCHLWFFKSSSYILKGLGELRQQLRYLYP
jgi:hypothetical protein